MMSRYDVSRVMVVIGGLLAGAGLAAATASAVEAGTPRVLLSNGDFETDASGNGFPDGWSRIDQASWEQDPDGNRFVRITAAEPGQMITLYRGVELRGEPQVLDVSARVRTHDVKRGSDNWHDARIVLHFIEDWGGEKLSPSPAAITFSQNSGDWVTVSRRVQVPEGATILEFMPAMFHVASGSLDIDDVTITPVDPDEAAAEAAQDARENPRYKREPTPEIEDLFAGDLPPMLHVVGNELRTIESDEYVWLQGVNVASLEWREDGEGVLQSIRVAIDDWNANVIRLPVKESYWFGRESGQRDGGEAYRKLVDASIYLAAERGAYTVLDLHRYRALAPEHLEFWLDAAERYKNHPAVIFGLINEPHSISWEVWRNGGTVEERRRAEGIAENEEAVVAMDSPGMQPLVEAIRATGANNIISASGLDWGYDLSGILEGYALEEQPGGHGIMYESHVYPWKRDWQNKFLNVAAEHPILIGEVGAPIERFDFIPESAHEEPATWVPDMLAVIQKYRLNWTGWCFHPQAGPRMLKDWSYEPTDYWGAPAKRALHGEPFELNRKR